MQKKIVKNSLIIIFISILATPTLIGAKNRNASSPFFKTVNKTVAIYPIKNSYQKVPAKILCKTCDSLNLQNIIKSEITTINKSLLSEFRRCAKFGLYTVVDTTLPRDLEVKIVFSTATIISDTLSIPFSVTTTETKSHRTIIKNFHHTALIPKYEDNPENSIFYSISRALATYRKTFPTENIVRLFYSKK